MYLLFQTDKDTCCKGSRGRWIPIARGLFEMNVKATCKQVQSSFQLHPKTKNTCKWPCANRTSVYIWWDVRAATVQTDTRGRTQPVLTVTVLVMVWGGEEGEGGKALMACCQGDTDQPGSVSFADANETLELLAKPPLETQTEPPAPHPAPSLEELGTWTGNPERRAQKRKEEKTQNYLFAFHICLWPPSPSLYPPPSLSCIPLPPPRSQHTPCLPRLLWERKVASGFRVSSNPPHWRPPLPPLPLHRFPRLELAFSEWGADGGGARCWITALSRRSTPPWRQQKRQTPLFGSGGKQLGTDDAG